MPEFYNLNNKLWKSIKKYSINKQLKTLAQLGSPNIDKDTNDHTSRQFEGQNNAQNDSNPWRII